MEQALARGSNANDSALKRSMSSLEKFAQVAAAVSKIRINATGAGGLQQLAAAMNAISRVRMPDAGKVRAFQEFARAMSTIRVPAGASGLAALGRAMAMIKPPSESAVKRIRELFAALNAYKPPASAGNLGALFHSLASLKVPSEAAIKRLAELFRTLSSARAIPNAQAIATSLNAVAAAAGHAGSAVASMPARLRTMSTGMQQAQVQMGSFRKMMASLSTMSVGGNRGGVGYQFSTLFTSMFSAFTLGEFMRNVTDATNNVMSLQKSLFFVTGTVQGTQEGMTAFNKTVMDLGLNLKETQGPFSRFLISAKEAGLTLKDSQKVFGDVALALRTVGATNEQQVQSFYALQEMMAKGKVQAKEFTRQLAQYIPGAAAFGAQALSQMRGVPETIASFYKEMKAGTIEAAPFVKSFSEILRQQFAPLQELMKLRPDYAINQFKSSLQLFYQEVGKNSMTALTSGLKEFTSALTENGELTPKIKQLADNIGQNIGKLAGEIGRVAIFAAKHIDLIIAGLKIWAGIKITATIFGWAGAMGQFVTKMVASQAATQAATAANAQQTASLNAQNAALARNSALQSQNNAAKLGGFGKRVSTASGTMTEAELGMAEAGQLRSMGVKAGSAARVGAAAEGVEAAELAGSAAAAEGAVGGLMGAIGALTGVLEVAVIAIGVLGTAWLVFKDVQVKVGQETTTVAGIFKAAGEVIGDNFSGSLKNAQSWFKGLGDTIGDFYQQHKGTLDKIGAFLGQAASVQFDMQFGPGASQAAGRFFGDVNKRAEKDAAADDDNRHGAPGSSLSAAEDSEREQERVQHQNYIEELRHQMEAQGKTVDDGDLEALSTKKQFAMISSQLGFSPNFLGSVNDIESPGGPQQRKGSKYAGYFQQGDQTWLEELFKYGKNISPELGDFVTKNIHEYQRQDGKGSYYGIMPQGGASKEQLEAMRSAVFGWRMSMPGLDAKLAGQDISARTATLGRQLGRTPDNAEAYLTWLLGEGGAHSFITQGAKTPGGNATAMVDAIFGSKIGEANPAVFSDKGRARTFEQVMTLLRKRIKDEGINPEDADPAKMFNQYLEQLTGYSALVGTANPGIAANLKMRDMQDKADKLKVMSAKYKDAIDPVTGKKVGEFYNQADVDAAMRQEQVKAWRANNPVAYENQQAGDALNAAKMKAAGLADEASWQEKIVKLQREGYDLAKVATEQEHQKFLELQRQEQLLAAREALLKTQNALYRKSFVEQGASPEQQELYDFIMEHEKNGATAQEKFANAQKDGIYGVAQQNASSQYQLERWNGLTEVTDQLKEQGSMAGFSPEQRAKQQILHDYLAQLTNAKGTTADLIDNAKKYNDALYGSYKNAYELAKALADAKYSMEHPGGLREWANGIKSFDEQLQQVKKNFVEGLSDGITDALMGNKKVNWSAIFENARRQMIKAQVDQTLSSFIKMGTPDPAKKMKGINGLIEKGQKLPGEDQASKLLDGATTLKSGATTLEVASTTLLNVLRQASSIMAAGGSPSPSSSAGTPGAGSTGAGSASGGTHNWNSLQGAQGNSTDVAGGQASLNYSPSDPGTFMKSMGSSIGSLTSLATGGAGDGGGDDSLLGSIGSGSFTPDAGTVDQVFPTDTLTQASDMAPISTDMPGATSFTPPSSGGPLDFFGSMFGGGGGGGMGDSQGVGSAGAMSKGFMQGIGKDVQNLGQIGIMAALGKLFKHKDKTLLQHHVNGVIGQESQNTLHVGKRIAASQNPIAAGLQMLFTNGMQQTGLMNPMNGASQGMGQISGMFNSMFGGGGNPGATSSGFSAGSGGLDQVFSGDTLSSMTDVSSISTDMPGATSFGDMSAMGDAASSVGSGMGDFMSSAGSWIASIFKEGGYTTQPVATQLASLATWRDAPHYREGTANTDGIPAILHPDEAVIPLSRNRKIPIEMPDSMHRSQSAPIIHSPITIVTPDADSFRASKNSLARQQNRTLKRAASRNLTGT